MYDICEEPGVGMGGDVSPWKSMDMPKPMADWKAPASMGEPGSSSWTLRMPAWAGARLVLMGGRATCLEGLGDVSVSAMGAYCESL